MASFFNQATLYFQGRVTNSNTTAGELIESLAATKTAISQDYGREDTIAYAISLVNSADTPLTNVTLTDNLGAYELGENTLYPLEYVEGSVRYFVNGVLNAAPTVNAGPSLTISGINVPAGGNALIIYEARTNEYAPLDVGSVITNVVNAEGGTLCGNSTSEAAVPVRVEALPFITKFASDDEIVCNGEITYTFIIQNLGNAEIVATDDLIVRDVFNPILNISSVVFNGTEWTEGANYTYGEATGEFATLPGQITVPAASYEQDIETGVITTTPGVATLTITGTV